MKQIWAKCIDGSNHHHFDPASAVTWKCRDCKKLFTMCGDNVVHITEEDVLVPVGDNR